MYNKTPWAVLCMLGMSHSAWGAEQCPTVSLVALQTPTTIGTGTAASCTQAAIQTALSQGGHLQFNCGTQAVTIPVTTELTVAKDTVLEGNGLVTLDGLKKTRILRKAENANLTIQNMGFKNGKAPNDSSHFSEQCGGAILAKGAGTTLTLINTSFTGNTVTNLNTSDIAGGAVYAFGIYEAVIANSSFSKNSASNGGAIGGLASGVRLINSSFSNNNAAGTGSGLRGLGGALYMDGVTNSANPNSNKLLHICNSQFTDNQGESLGGATYSVFSDNKGSQAIIESSSFENNSTRSSSKGQGGAVFHMEDDLAGGSNEQNFTIKNSLFANNSTFSQGGAVWTLIEGKITIENTTFSKNRVEDTELGMGGGLAISKGNVSITNSTFAENYAWFHGGGIQAATTPKIKLTNTLFYKNESDRDWAAYQMNREADTDGGGNLQYPEKRFNQSGTPKDISLTPSIFIADPKLAGLADNGGSTKTHALLTGSAAIDAGVAGGCPSTDQRGATRSMCDIGAYEVADLPVDPVDTPFSITAIASGNLASATLSAHIKPASGDLGQQGSVYVAAQLGELIYFHTGQTWVQWTAGAFPSYASGVLQEVTLPILQAMDVRPFIGTVIYVGYGRNQDDMLQNNKLTALYTVQ